MTVRLSCGAWRAAVALTLTLAAGCRSADRARDSAGQPSDSTVAAGAALATGAAPGAPADRDPHVEGVVGTMGSEPAVMIMVRPPNEAAVRVDGPLAAEVGRLTGATVILFGAIQPTTPWRTIEPARYEVLAIDGQKPHVGVLRVEQGEVRLESSPPLRLEGAPDALRAQHGAKVYVLGAVRNGVLTVQSFGVIRPLTTSDHP